MTFTGSLSGLSVCEENSSEETSVSLSYVSGTVVGKTEVEAGKVYITSNPQLRAYMIQKRK